MDPDKNSFLLAHLQKSQSALEAAVRQIESDDWLRSPAPDRWSAGECAEHIVIVENLVQGRLGQLESIPEEAFDEVNSTKKDAIILSVIERERRFECPPFAKPASRYTSAERMLEGFHTAHQRLIEIAAANPTWLRGRFLEHPVLNKLDGYQWILVTSCHTMRHVAQIHEIQQQLNA